MALKFNVGEMMSDFRRCMYVLFEQALDDWEADVKKYMNPELVSEYKAEIKANIQVNVNKIMVYLEANPGALAENFGTGSLIDTSNPYFDEYFSNKGSEKGQVNKERNGLAIVGRPKGTYIDIFGNQHTVEKGTLAGKPIEGFYIGNGNTITPTKPSHAIQQATRFFYYTYTPIIIKSAVKMLRLSKYITEENVK